MNRLTPEQRSDNMRRIRGRDTGPEMIVRRLVHGLGYRYRLHRRDLPGKPDMVFPKRGKVIFIHGCFWHQHQGCSDGHQPRSNRGYWQTKLANNLRRDSEHMRQLEAAGWNILVIWECELADRAALTRRIQRFLNSSLAETDGR